MILAMVKAPAQSGKAFGTAFFCAATGSEAVIDDLSGSVDATLFTVGSVGLAVGHTVAERIERAVATGVCGAAHVDALVVEHPSSMYAGLRTFWRSVFAVFQAPGE